MKITPPIFILAVLFFSVTVSANEPLWTNQERAAKSDAVVTGKVLSVTQVGELNQQDPAWHEKLMKAQVRVKKIRKNHSLVNAETTDLYYAAPFKEGGGRCPDYVDLSAGKVADFYLRVRPALDKKEALFIDMDSDVRDPKECMGSKAKKNLFCGKK